MRPKYSIIIPTRNRAHLLQYALQSALQQHYDDYEIIVVDNYSSDTTRSVVERKNHPRISYFQTGKTLSMPDNWDFALEKARGEWITFLCDDNAISPHLLEIVDAVVKEESTQVVSWTYADYFFDTWKDPKWKNLLRIFTHTGERVRYDSKAKLSLLFANFLRDDSIPIMHNSFCHRAIIEEIQRLAGRFFIPTCPDYASAAVTLAMTSHYIFVSLPLYVGGSSMDSVGASGVFRAEAFWEHFREFESDYFQEAPINTLVLTNYITETLLRVKKALPGIFKKYEINWNRYFVDCWNQLEEISDRGIDVSAERKEFLRVLKSRSLGFRAGFALNKFSRNFDHLRPRKLARVLLNSVPLLGAIEGMFRHRPQEMVSIYGRDGGFADILEALEYLDRRTGVASQSFNRLKGA